MSRLIVEVRRIDKVDPHPNADRLDIATVEGWQCIIAKEQFKVGDLCVFIPPDSILTKEFIEKHQLDFVKDNGRIRALKLRGFISQGLVMEAPAGAKVGQDMARAWGITKWEPPEPKSTPRSEGRGKGKNSPQLRPNSNFAMYTDIDNVRNFKNIIQEGEEVVITEKIHGTNFRVGWVPRDYKKGIIGWFQRTFLSKLEFVVGSRKVQLTIFTPKHAKFYGGDIYTKIAKQLKLNEIIPQIPLGCVLYGEIFGPGIQDLTYGRTDLDVRFFGIMIDGKYVDEDAFLTNIAELGLEAVPVLYRGPFSEEIMLQHTVGDSTLCPGQIREGCVVTPVKERFDGRLGRVILKSINPEYLIRKNGTEGH